jgi:LPXTG-site transpeptidase (sortase) family protein
MQAQSREEFRSARRPYPSGSRPDLGIYPLRERPIIEPRQETTTPQPTPVSAVQPVASVRREQAIKQYQAPSTLAVTKPTVEPKKRVRPNLVGSMLIVIALIILAIVAITAYATWRQNQQVRDKVTTIQASAVSTDREGTNETKVTKSDLDSYVVSADMPRILRIPTLDVQARILRMGITDGRVQAPESIWDTGWYDGSAKPGEAGTSFIDGHVSGPSQPAIFAKLDTLKTGDRIEIEKGDGSLLRYSVKNVETIPVDKVDIRRILNSGGSNGLVIMTCGGAYLGNYTYDSRVVVHADRMN